MIEVLGNFVLWQAEGIGRFFAVLTGALRALATELVTFRLRTKDVIHHIYAIGVESLPVVGFCLGFVSLMLILEFSYHMKLVLRQDSLVPAFSTVLMMRELGPVVTALLLASRVGAGMAAEIGSMAITEQIDALRLIGLEPVKYLTVPRLVASIFSTVACTVIAIAIAILGGASIASASLHQSVGEFFNTMFTFIKFSDLTAAIIKAAAFGAIIPIVATYRGLYCERGSEGVGNAATQTVVTSSVLIILSDFVLTYFLYAL